MLAVVLALLAVLSAGVGWYMWHSYQDLLAAQARNLQVEELSGVITHLDEVLTMSARMGVTTADPQWEARYERFEPQLDAAIQETKLLAPDVYGSEGATQTDTANIALVDMEHRAFDLVRAGQLEAATSLLFSPEYEEQKRIYAEGNEQLAASLHASGDASVASSRRQWIVAVAAEGVLLLAAFSFAVLLSINITKRTQALATANEELELENTKRRQAEEVLRESEERSRLIINTAYDAFMAMDADGFITDWNAQAEATFGWSRAEAVGRKLADTIISLQYRDAHNRGLGHFLTTGEGPVLNKRTEITACHRDGREFPVELAVWPVRSGETYTFNAFVHDITERKRMEEELRERGRRDALTGVLNHGAIVEDLKDLISSGCDGASCAVAMVDVDELKVVNDTFGHQMGDAVLCAVARALDREGAVVGRYGGDEFVVILAGTDRAAAERYGDAVGDELARANLADPEAGASVPAAATIGLAIYPEDAGTVAELIELSDNAMYAARRQRPVEAGGLTAGRPLNDDRAAEMIGQIVPLLTSEGGLDSKLRLVAHRLSVGADYDAVNLSLFPPETGAPVAASTFARAPKELVEAWNQNQRNDTGSHPMRLLLERTRRPVILDDPWNDEHLLEAERNILRAADLKSALVAPMLWHDQAIGLLGVASKLEAAFTPRDARFLAAVATQVTAIVRMATLVEELQSTSGRLLKAQTETVMLLAAAAEAHDHATGLHLQSVRSLSEALARELGHSEEEASALGLAAVLHDIGKIRVPDSILASTGELAEEEWELMKQHPNWGAEFLAGRPGFELAASIARSHHERWDGTGYPDSLAGDAIPEVATIVAVADAFDAMTSDRPYRTAWPVGIAVQEIVAYSGKQFSPKVAAALVSLAERHALPGGRWTEEEEEAVA